MYKSVPAATKAEKKSGKKKVSIALQGGGSHGAFSWGVMDRILEDGRFEIEGLTGTSIFPVSACNTLNKTWPLVGTKDIL